MILKDGNLERIKKHKQLWKYIQNNNAPQYNSSGALQDVVGPSDEGLDI